MILAFPIFHTPLRIDTASFPMLCRSVKQKLEEAAAKVAEITELGDEIENSGDVTRIVKKLQGDVLGLREEIKVGLS